MLPGYIFGGGKMIVTVELKRESFRSYATIACDAEGEAFLDWLHLGRGEMRLTPLLRKLFRVHRYFYKEFGVNEEAADLCHPDDTNFSTECSGFVKFLRTYFGAGDLDEINKTGLEKLSVIITKKLKELMQQYIEDKKTAKVTTTICAQPQPTVQEEQEELPNVQIVSPGFLVLGNAVYSIQLSRTDGMQGIYQAISTSVKEMYEIYTKQWQTKVKELQEKLEKQKENIFWSALEFLREATEKGWQYQEGRFVYPRVEMKFVKYGGKLYKAPFGYYAERVEIDPEDEDVYVQSANHPNISGEGEVCLGDLVGKDCKILFEQLPKLLETGNLDSAFDNEASRTLSKQVESLQPVGEVWTNG
jgi:hypothetical protein